MILRYQNKLFFSDDIFSFIDDEEECICPHMEYYDNDLDFIWHPSKKF